MEEVRMTAKKTGGEREREREVENGRENARNTELKITENIIGYW